MFQGFNTMPTAVLLSELAAMEDCLWRPAIPKAEPGPEEEKPLQARQLAGMVGAFEDAEGKKIKPHDPHV